ncbi:MAG: hypothetical protein ACM31O_19270 [Bacteroidota bacterium]
MTTAMTKSLETSDVPLVAPEHLAMAMRVMIESEKGLVLLRGASSADLNQLEEAIWDRIQGDLAYRRAVLLRFRCLVDVFSARRLRTLMLRRGYNLIAPAIHVAASMRLNTKWGFSPQKFCLALHQVVGQLETRPTAPAAVEGAWLEAAA